MKILINLIGLALIIGGCATTKKDVQVPFSEFQKNDKLVSLVSDCRADDVESCQEAADFLYKNGYYKEAALSYDDTCRFYQYIPACLKLAKMFEKGQGVTKSKINAQDIYRRACYMGDKPSCSKFDHE